MWNPTEGWLPTSSYVEAVVPPDVEPGASPLVCLQVSSVWLPYVIGSLMQLVQPTTWDTTDPTVRQLALDRATALIEMFGTAGECTAVEFRFTDDCLLQYSVDGGTTWTTVPGWASFAPTCFTGPEGPEGPEGPAGPAPMFRMDGCNLQYSADGGDTWTTVTGWGSFTQDCIPPGAPANPLDSDTNTLACSIAAYFATQVINAGIQHVVDEINDSKTLVQTVQSLLGLGFLIDVPIALGLELGTLAFNLIQTLNLTDLQAGLSDSGYFGDVMCAIFLAIQADGMITAANWASVQAAIDAVTAPNAATASAVSSYVDNMSANSAMYLQQQGPIYEGDCSGCGTWCYEWDFTLSDGGWSHVSGRGSWVSGHGWESQLLSGQQQVYIYLPTSPIGVTAWGIKYTNTGALTSDGVRWIWVDGSGTHIDPTGDTTIYTSPHVASNPASITGLTEADFNLASNSAGSLITILAVQLQGNGANPFGTNNCTF